MKANVYQPHQLGTGAWVLGFGGTMSEADARAEIAKLNGTDRMATPDTIINVTWQDGEILSGYTAHGNDAKQLEQLGLAHYVDGWGYVVNETAVNRMALNGHISLKEATEYTRPGREVKAQIAARAENERAERFELARRTHRPVVIDSYTDECNDRSEECSLDNVTVYAMPDGTTKTNRTHTY